jgi:hypothetical protein
MPVTPESAYALAFDLPIFTERSVAIATTEYLGLSSRNADAPAARCGDML